jgi:hypothetical protein
MPKPVPPRPLYKPLEGITWDEFEELERADWSQERL